MQFIIIALVWIKVYSVVVHWCPLVTNGKQGSRLWNCCCRARVCFLSYLFLWSTLSQNVNNNFKGELKTSCHLLPGGNGVYNYLNLIYSSPHLLMSWIFQETLVEQEARPKETDNHLTWRTMMCGIQPANKNHLTLRVESVLGWSHLSSKRCFSSSFKFIQVTRITVIRVLLRWHWQYYSLRLKPTHAETYRGGN